MTQKIYKHLPIIAALFIVLFGTLYALRAKADISNPHPTPPSNSVTNAMLTSSAVQDNVVPAGANISATKVSPRGTTGSLLLSDGTNIASTTLLTLATTTNPTLTVTATSTLAGTTTVTVGNFGVGTTTPSQAVSVNGTIYTNTSVEFPDGTTQATAAAAKYKTICVHGQNPSTHTTSYVLLDTCVIPANTVGNNDKLTVAAVAYNSSGNASTGCELLIGNGAATTTEPNLFVTAGGGVMLEAGFQELNSAASNFIWFREWADGNGTLLTPTFNVNGSGVISPTTYAMNANLYIAVACKDSNNTDVMNLASFEVTRIIQ